MWHLRSVGLIVLCFTIISAACSPISTPTQQAGPTSSSPSPSPVSPVVQKMTSGSSESYIDGSTLVAVPAGPFPMGHGGEDDPQHTVNLADFWIYQTKVTNQQYGLCLNQGQCTAPDANDAPGFSDAQHAGEPVVGVTWDQAAGYCAFVGGTLPTEAQWEKTARGPNGNIYPWGSATPTNDLLNFNNAVGGTTDVFNYPAGKSFYGALDMAGNAFEWTADWYDPGYYSTSPSANPTGPATGETRSLRGSSFKSIPDQITSALRFSQKPGVHKPDLGFRCVVPNPQLLAPLCQTTALMFPPGNQPTPLPPYNCPPTGIDMRLPGCNGKTAFRYITMPPGAKMTVPAGLNCQEQAVINGYTEYVCTGAPNTYVINIKVSCSAPAQPAPLGQPQCSLGYQYDPGTSTCVFKGTSQSSSCLPGYNFDASKSCCTAQSGTNYPLCPAGQSYDSKGKTCLPMLQSVVPFFTSVNMTLNACGSSNNGGGCQPQSCSPGYSWDSQKCQCVCAGGHC